MFPLPWNFPFRKKDGTIVNVVDAMGGGGGGGSNLPDYDSSDAGKVLGVDENGDLEWSEAVGNLASDFRTLSRNVDDLGLTVSGLDNSVDAVSDNADVLIKNGAINMLPNNAITKTINGVTFTVNNDGSVNIDGTATQVTEFSVINKGIVLEPGNYILSTKNNIPTNVYFSIYIMGQGWKHVTDDENSIEFSKDSDIEISMCRFWIASGTTVSDLTAYPMIADARYSGDYVQYAMSNHELTEENIPAFKDRVDILGAKNFLRNDAVSKEESGVTFTVRDDGTILVSGTATAEILLTIRDDLYLPDGEYTISLEPIAPNQYAEIDVSIKSADDSEVLETFKLGNPQAHPTFENEHTFSYSSATAGRIIIVLKIWNTTVMQDAVIKPMIRLASDNNSEYQPYSKTNQELTENVKSLSQLFSNLLLLRFNNVSIAQGHGYVQCNFTSDMLSAFSDLISNGYSLNIISTSAFTTSDIIVQGFAMSIYGTDTYLRFHYINDETEAKVVDLRVLLLVTKLPLTNLH